MLCPPEFHKEWEAFLSQMSPECRALAERFPPWKSYRMITGQVCEMYSYAENMTLTVLVDNTQAGMGICRVFGVPPEHVEEIAPSSMH